MPRDGASILKCLILVAVLNTIAHGLQLGGEFIFDLNNTSPGVGIVADDVGWGFGLSFDNTGGVTNSVLRSLDNAGIYPSWGYDNTPEFHYSLRSVYDSVPGKSIQGPIITEESIESWGLSLTYNVRFLRFQLGYVKSLYFAYNEWRHFEDGNEYAREGYWLTEKIKRGIRVGTGCQFPLRSFGIWGLGVAYTSSTNTFEARVLFKSVGFAEWGRNKPGNQAHAN